MISSSGGNLVPCIIPELELFSKKKVQTVVTGHYTERLRPLNSLSNNLECLEFVSAGRPLGYLDVSDMNLRLVVQLRKVRDQAALKNVDADKNTSVVDNLLHSMFNSVEIFLSETPVTKSPHYYAYKALIDLYSSTSSDARSSQLEAALFCPDDKPESAQNCTSWTKRQSRLLLSQKCELFGRLRSDFNNLQPRLYLIDNVPLRVKLNLNPQEFFLWSKTEPCNEELVISEADLFLKYYNVTPDVSLAVERTLLSQPARYNFMSTQIRTFVHPAQSELINLPLCFSGKLPSLVILTFVKSGDLAGGFTKNPFYFPHSNLRELSFFCNGVERKFEMDMSATQHCTSVLKSLYHQLGYRKEETSGNLFTLDRLRNGFFFCAADFTFDESGSGPSQNLDLSGSIRITGKLKAPLDHSLCVLLYAFFPSCVEINAAREVVLI